VILDAGDAFFASAVLANRNAEGDKLQAKGLLQGYATIGCDALNVGGFDLAAGKDFLMSLAEGSSIPFISANLTDTENNLLFRHLQLLKITVLR
jgi:2',3'-cyclic-nucleotide 2'-phosphodiesterase (5'-nucleotidase family)